MVHHGSSLTDELRRRFPLIESLVGCFGRACAFERFPLFFGLIISAASRESPGACCLVLDKTSGTTASASILSALTRLKVEFPRLVRNYARVQLDPGQLVRVKPRNFVYEYDGLVDGYPDFFRLRILDKEAWRSFPITDVLRLEPTDSVWPKGTGKEDLAHIESGPLDRILDLPTCGNNSVFENAVLLFMPRSRFTHVAGNIVLARHEGEQSDPLSRFLPWGSIRPDGSLAANDTHQVVGAPLIAVTNVLQDLAAACLSADVASRMVFADGARAVARDLQAFDDISSSQRVVVLASPEEYEEVEILRNRGCPVWDMSPDALLIGESAPQERDRRSLVGGTVRAAKIRQFRTVNTVECHDEIIEGAAQHLENAATLLGGLQEVLDVDAILARLLRILFECSECCLGVHESTANELKEAEQSILEQERWIERTVLTEFKVAIRILKTTVSDRTGTQKSEALLEAITEPGKEWALAARSPRTAQQLKGALARLGSDVPVLYVSTIGSGTEYDGVIVPAWPNARKFDRLTNLSIAPEIRVLAYPFERKRVTRQLTLNRHREGLRRLDPEDLAAIVGVNPRLLCTLDRKPLQSRPEQPSRDLVLDPAIHRFEQRVLQRSLTHSTAPRHGEDHREAQLVRFVGGCYALLTEWAALPKLNDLFDGRTGETAKLARVTVSELAVGDFVLFRAAGDKDFVRLVAEEGLGEAEYRRIREVAESWKPALRSLGTGPGAVQRRLASYGLNRTVTTIAAWLSDHDRIGPGNLDDINTIARAAGNEKLSLTMDQVKRAISQIRRAHRTAGTLLTKLILDEIQHRQDELGDDPTLLDLGYGQAWAVQVESVDPEQHECSVTFVNRLLWEADNEP